MRKHALSSSNSLRSCRPAQGGAPRCCWPRPAVHHTSNSMQFVAIERGAAAVKCTASSSDTAAVSTGVAAGVQTDYFATDKRPVILFDGVCNLCNGGVNFMLDWDKEGVYRFAALQSTAGQQLLVRCGRRPDDISSIVLVEEDCCYIKSDAVLRIATRLNMPLPLLAGLAFQVPKFIRDPFYDQVANNRYLVFGRTNSCRVSDNGFAERFLGTTGPGQ